MSLTAAAEWLLRWSEVLGMIGSTLLSAALVYFYREMRDVQQTQAEIQERQTELVETQTDISRANHEPLLRFSNLSFGKRDRIELEIENIGNGIATDLSLLCVIAADNDYYQIDPTRTAFGKTGELPTDQQRNLTAGEKEEFSSPVLVRLQSNHFSDTLSWFTAATAKLAYTGTQSCTVRLVAQYKNILGDVRTEPITSASVWLIEGKSIEESLSQLMDPIAEGMPSKGSAPIDSRHIGTQRTPGRVDNFEIDFNTLDLVLKYGLQLDITAPPEIQCRIERGRGVGSQNTVDTVEAGDEKSIQFGEDEHDYLEYGELVHIFGSTGEEDWQIDIIGAGDYPLDGPPHAGTMQRQLMIK